MKKKSIKEVNSVLKQLRRDVTPGRFNIITKILEFKIKKTAPVQKRPQILKAPAKKLKYDMELTKIERRLRNLEGKPEPTIKRSIFRPKLKEVNHKSIKETQKKTNKLFSIFEKILSPNEKRLAKQEAIREVKIAAKKIKDKAPTNELAKIEEELSKTNN
jgi:hypothetical protein